MTKGPYVQLAPIVLKDGIDEAALIAASDAFDTDFVRKQSGILKRVLLRDRHGRYADLVFFDSKEAADRVAEAEATSEACAAFFAIMQTPDGSTDLGILSFEHVKTYE